MLRDLDDSLDGRRSRYRLPSRITGSDSARKIRNLSRDIRGGITRYASGGSSSGGGKSGGRSGSGGSSFRQLSQAVVNALGPIAELLGGLGGLSGGGGGSGGGGTGGGSGVGGQFFGEDDDRDDARNTGGGTGGGAFDNAIREAINLLTSHGYTVTPPTSTRQKQTEEPPPGFTRQPPRPQPGPAPFPLGQKRQRVNIGGRSREYNPNDPVFSGEMIRVDSSNVHSIGYEFNAQAPAKGTVKVRFLQKRSNGSTGPGPLYHYEGVHPDTFDAFLQAGSKGSFVWDRFRVRGTVSGHRVPYSLQGITNGYVPRKATRLGQNEYYLQRQAFFRSSSTGERREFSSSLPDQFVQDLNAGPGGGRRTGPTGFVPRNGAARQPSNGR